MYICIYIYIWESWRLCFFFCHLLSFVYQYYPLFAYCNYSYIQWNTFYTLEAQTYDLQLQVRDAGYRFKPPMGKRFSIAFVAGDIACFSVYSYIVLFIFTVFLSSEITLHCLASLNVIKTGIILLMHRDKKKQSKYILCLFNLSSKCGMRYTKFSIKGYFFISNFRRVKTA